MANLDEKIQDILGSTEVVTDYHPIDGRYYARGKFNGTRVTAYIRESEADALGMSPEAAKYEVMNRLYKEATSVVRAQLLAQEEMKLGLGYAGPVLE